MVAIVRADLGAVTGIFLYLVSPAVRGVFWAVPRIETRRGAVAIAKRHLLGLQPVALIVWENICPAEQRQKFDRVT